MDKKEKTNLRIVYAVIGAFAFIFITYHGFNSYIDHRIKTVTNDSNFLKQLALRTRPSLIFDETESIIADMGAASLIEDINISDSEKKGGGIIIVTPKEYLGIAPTLEALDFGYSITVERGEKYNWVYTRSPISYLITADSPPKRGVKERFRLEIIR